MRTVVFFMYLCSLLLAGNNHAHAGTYDNDINYVLDHIQQKKQVQFANTDLCREIIGDTDLGNEHEQHLFTDDAEDEDADDFVAKKYKSASGCYLVTPSQSYQSIIEYLYNNFKAPPYFCGLVSNRYLIQRSLKI